MNGLDTLRLQSKVWGLSIHEVTCNRLVCFVSNFTIFHKMSEFIETHKDMHLLLQNKSTAPFQLFPRKNFMSEINVLEK